VLESVFLRLVSFDRDLSINLVTARGVVSYPPGARFGVSVSAAGLC
jgi:hypothetical protein